MASFRDWLQLFRTQTSPLEVCITILGAALGAGAFLDWHVLGWALMGWLYHNAGYGQNSVEDYAGGFDADDPNKVHHPLQRGAITIMQGRIVTYSLIVIFFLSCVILSGLDPLSIVLLVILVASGLAYNIWGKRLSGKFIPIALAHSLLFPLAYFGSGGGIEPDTLGFRSGGVPVVLWCTAAFLAQVTYQIMIEGDLKDIDQPEASLLKRMGVHLRGSRLHVSQAARMAGLLTKAVNVFLIIGVAVELKASVGVLVVLALMGLGMIYLDHRLMNPGNFDHAGTMKRMALMEVLSVFAMIVALSPAFHPDAFVSFLLALGLMGAAMAYFVIFNRLLWGTTLRPKV